MAFQLPPLVLRPMPLRIERSTLTNALKASLLAGAADLTVQVACNKPRSIWDLNYRRAISFSAFSLFYAGFFQVAVYRSFDRWFGVGKSMRVVLTKVAADCFLHAPLVYIPSFYVGTGMVQGLGWTGSLKKLKDKYPETLRCYFMIWSWPMFICFKYVPVNHRVLFIAGCAFIEKSIYSWIGQRK